MVVVMYITSGNIEGRCGFSSKTIVVFSMRVEAIFLAWIVCSHMHSSSGKSSRRESVCVCLYREISSTDVREEIAEDKLSFLSLALFHLIKRKRERIYS